MSLPSGHLSVGFLSISGRPAGLLGVAAPPTASIDLTAMIDVIFLLLIFWMTVVRLASAPDAEVLHTPFGDETVAVDIPRDVLSITWIGGDELRVQGRRLNLASLIEIIGRGELPEHVLVRANADADAQALVSVLSALRTTGIGTVGLAVRPLESGSTPRGEPK